MPQGQYIEYVVHNSHLTVTGRFRPLIPVPGVTSYGGWSEFSWCNQGALQHGARLVPERAPWHDLFDALDIGGASLPSGPVTTVEEADAIVACCWRYGSYVHVLTGGESYPEFRKNSALSRISDSEMKRINLEFSSGLAAWLTDRATDPEKINRRIRAALSLLPMPWRRSRNNRRQEAIRARADRLVEGLRVWLHALPARLEPKELALRAEANWIVLTTYRNGGIEALHAGMWSHGTEIPGFGRLHEGEIDGICKQTVEQLAMALEARARLGADFRRLCSVGLPSNWSETEETSPVEYAGLPSAGPLGPRLRWLAEKYPTVYDYATSPVR